MGSHSKGVKRGKKGQYHSVSFIISVKKKALGMLKNQAFPRLFDMVVCAGLEPTTTWL